VDTKKIVFSKNPKNKNPNSKVWQQNQGFWYLEFKNWNLKKHVLNFNYKINQFLLDYFS